MPDDFGALAGRVGREANKSEGHGLDKFIPATIFPSGKLVP
jgi:hypothetical protein